MSQLQALSVVVAPEAAEAVAELLQRLTGTGAVSTHSRITGLSTVTVFLSAPGPTAKRKSHGNSAIALPSAAALRGAVKDGLAAIAACDLDLGPARVSLRRVPPEDWRESWKRHFRPLVVGRALLVRPSWSRRRPVPGQAELVLDPGLSFGTGQHPTTEFCLRELVRLRPTGAARRGGKSGGTEVAGLLDVGTGSGILALAAARLGYAPVVGFDFDPEAVTVAADNARRNRLTGRVAFSRGDVARLSLRQKRRYPVVCANLTADLLQRHAARLVAQVAPGGHLVLAGILAEEFSAVRRCFEALGLTAVRSRHRREWESGSFQRPLVDRMNRKDGIKDRPSA